MMLLCLEEALEHFSDCSIKATRPLAGKNSGLSLGIILLFLSVKGKATSKEDPPPPQQATWDEQGKSHRGDGG
jgi:hypothetical protein